jgi:RNA polymerase sigma-70 factor (ECF subfamily)
MFESALPADECQRAVTMCPSSDQHLYSARRTDDAMELSCERRNGSRSRGIRALALVCAGVWRTNCDTAAMQEILETELIARCRQGDQPAIAELFRRHYGASLRRARGILRQPDDAQDAVQTGFFLAFRHLGDFRGEASFKTWITRIVVNCCLLQLREARRRATWVPLEDRYGMRGTDILPSGAPTPEKSAWCGEISSALSVAVANLPQHLREAYTLFAISGLPLREVAMALGLTVSATKTRLFRARAGIRMSLKPVWSVRRAR